MWNEHTDYIKQTYPGGLVNYLGLVNSPQLLWLETQYSVRKRKWEMAAGESTKGISFIRGIPQASYFLKKQVD